MNQISHTQKIGHSRQALPFGARPLSGAMLSHPVSSMTRPARATRLDAPPPLATAFHVRASRSSAISVSLKPNPQPRRKRQTVSCLTSSPRSASISCNTAGEFRTRSNIHSRRGSRTGRRYPPIFAGLTEPVRAARSLHFTKRPTAQLQTAPQPGDGSLQPASRKQHVREDHSGKVASSLPASFTGMDPEPHPTLKGNPNSMQPKTEPI